MEYTTILVEKKAGIAKVTLNRPQALNAMNVEMLDELSTALRDIQQDDDINVVILTGSGRAFSAGRDIKQIQQFRQEQRGYFRPGGPVYGLLEQIDKPVIAAVNGFCYTGALELMLCIMKNNQVSVRTIKSLVRICQRTDLSAGLELEALAFRKHAESRAVSDGQSRISFFTEKKESG